MKINWSKIISIKWLKRLNQRMVIHGLAVGLLLAMGFWGFTHFRMVQGVLKSGKIAPSQSEPLLPAQPPNNPDYSFLKSKDVFNPARAVKPLPTPPPPPEIKYDILGVAQNDVLYLVVEFKKDNKVKLFAKGERIENLALIEELSLDSVTIVQNGIKSVQKIVKTDNFKDLRPSTSTAMPPANFNQGVIPNDQQSPNFTPPMGGIPGTQPNRPSFNNTTQPFGRPIPPNMINPLRPPDNRFIDRFRLPETTPPNTGGVKKEEKKDEEQK